MKRNEKIIYTITDEAPALATFSLLPIIKSFVAKADIDIEIRDISLAARILAKFPECLSIEQKKNDDLSELGILATSSDANIIKLPNISASIPQLNECIRELQAKGFAVPGYPEKPTNESEKLIKEKYDTIKGSAVNPVLREGNSDRRCSPAVKAYAKANPHAMGSWNIDSKSKVSSMKEGDFFANEKSIIIEKNQNVRIELYTDSGKQICLKEEFELEKGDVLDSTYMSVKSLKDFLIECIQASKKDNLLFSLHMKATMMKVSDPIIFGYAVSTYFDEVFKNCANILKKTGANERNGLGDIISNLENLEEADKQKVLENIEFCMQNGPDIAMVDSDKGITNLHVPSDVIIDASMPAAIRSSGKMWNNNGKLQDTNFIIPDRSYAGVYSETIEFCKNNGAFDPKTMGSVSNIGLMAKKAEEYGSHDKTFEIASDGNVKIINNEGVVLSEHKVKKGDIWRACIVKDSVIKNWVNLAVDRARETNTPIIFWLDKNRGHDAKLIDLVNFYLNLLNTDSLDIKILSPADATRATLIRMKEGKNTISVTGNVLRDYLTDLFPILELGTSAKMLSIVPLMNGGGLFETGAGGSAPKHVQQLTKENHLRWDSLGEFLALGVSLEHLAKIFNNEKASVLSSSLDVAIEKFLLENRSPSREVNELDNRGSHFYFALYWAEAISKQKSSIILADIFSDLYELLKDAQEDIVSFLNNNQGNSIDLNGYYYLSRTSLEPVMRPCETFNRIIDQF